VTVGRRYPRQPSDTTNARLHVPLFEFDSLEDLAVPHGCTLVGIEQAKGARPLPSFQHPQCALYLLGAEDSGIPAAALERCHQLVAIATPMCVNVAVAGSIVMYDRQAKGP
jgi:tRNA G18 (ribose-2'-O)-methylase SpoU